ncbi:CinA family protein [Pedomonas mirosovicensis]|uniref:CinA family protein n=1 Tax=Pedomonas mirosovicensis TaxID=2908641 RepID=UPI002167D4C0|nr:CinA family protein [Pedomonas mirosovicensis]MCH8685253.1 CinA family protein [Pedomonas mirosovicensis]
MLFPDDISAKAQAVIEACRARGLRVATAESCTGGLVAAALTDVPGSSDVLDRGFVVYSNEAKMETLGVSLDVLETFGAVSVAVAWAIAHGALLKSNADVAVGVTGIAGPGGGSEMKPVGMVVFALARRGDDPENAVADTRFFDPELGRDEIRLQAVRVALDLLMPEESPPAP